MVGEGGFVGGGMGWMVNVTACSVDGEASVRLMLFSSSSPPMVSPRSRMTNRCLGHLTQDDVSDCAAWKWQITAATLTAQTIS